MAAGGEVRGRWEVRQSESVTAVVKHPVNVLSILSQSKETICPAQREGWQLSGTQSPYCHPSLHKTYGWGGFR